MGTPIATNLAIARFGANEDCINTFVNTIMPYTTNTTPPQSVQSLPSFIASAQASVNSAVLSLATINNRGTWTTATIYAVKDIVSVTVSSVVTWYVCIVPHTSGATFTGDSATKWVVYQGTATCPIFQSVAALRANAITNLTSSQIIGLTDSSYSGGKYVASADVASVDNGNSIIVDTIGTRWYKIYSDSNNSSSIFNYLTQAQIQQVLSGSPTFDIAPIIMGVISATSSSGLTYIWFPRGTYLFNSTCVMTTEVELCGDQPTFLVNVPNGYAFSSNTVLEGNTFAGRVMFTGLTFKVYGSFGTGTSGGINFLLGASVQVTDCVFWNLGGTAILLNAIAQRGVIRDCHFLECQDNADIIKATAIGTNGNEYTLVIENNFISFANGGISVASHYGINATSTFNLDIRNNAFEFCGIGALIGYYGLTAQGRISNNFFEGNNVGVQLGFEHSNGYYGFIENLVISENQFTTTGTGVLVVGACKNISILNNAFAGQGPLNTGLMLPVSVLSKMSSGINIGANTYLQSNGLNYSNRTTGTAYPFGISALDATIITLDSCNSLTGWGIEANSTGLGVLSLGNGMPALSKNSLQINWNAGNTNEFFISKTITSTDVSACPFFVVAMWIDDPSKLGGYTDTSGTQLWPVLQLGNSPTSIWSFYLQNFSNGKTTTLVPGWNLITLEKSDAYVSYASPAPTSWSAITFIGLATQCTYSGTAQPVVKFGGVYGVTLNGTMQYAVPQIL